MKRTEKFEVLRDRIKQESEMEMYAMEKLDFIIAEIEEVNNRLDFLNEKLSYIAQYEDREGIRKAFNDMFDNPVATVDDMFNSRIHKALDEMIGENYDG